MSSLTFQTTSLFEEEEKSTMHVVENEIVDNSIVSEEENVRNEMNEDIQMESQLSIKEETDLPSIQTLSPTNPPTKAVHFTEPSPSPTKAKGKWKNMTNSKKPAKKKKKPEPTEEVIILPSLDVKPFTGTYRLVFFTTVELFNKNVQTDFVYNIRTPHSVS